jgi:stearoyl-CoA desaturase (delta-9 desaturase)
MNPHFYKIILPSTLISLLAVYLIVTDFHWIYIIYTLLGFYILGIFGNTIGFHRYLTHQSFEVNKFWHILLVTLGSLTGQSSPIFWSALHLHHHRNSDTDLDVHTPKKGFWQSAILWQIKESLERLPGFIAPRKHYKDPYIRFIHQNYYKFYWGWGLMFLLIDPHFFVFFFIFGGYFLTAWGDNLSNYFFHSPRFGYATYDTKDNSRNVPLISWVTLGAGWHNNHHNNPGSHRFGEKPNEIDIGAMIIELIKK